MRNRKAQSTLEYLIILSAITAAIILFATGTLRQRVGGMYNSSVSAMENMTSKITFGN